MHLARVRSLLLVLFAAAALAAGCGEGTLSSPTGPSQLSDAAAIGMDAPDALASVSEDGLAPAGDALVALDRGRGSNGDRDGKDKEKGKQEKDRSDRGPGNREDDDEDSDDEAEDQDDDDEDSDDDRRADRRQNLSGFVTAVGTDSITVRGIIVKVTPTTMIRHGNRQLRLADIKPGDHAQAKGMMSADGLTLTASEIKVEDTGRDNDDDDDDDDNQQVTLTGVVAGLPTPPPCSALTFTVGTTIVNTNASTVFDDVACTALVNGNTVEVKGVRRADGSILATRVELQSGPNEVKGAISGLASTAGCPTLSFMVGTTTVTTTGTTVFEEAACVALANGTRVEVEGTLTGTTLAAAKIELDN